MKDKQILVTSAITTLLAFGIGASSVSVSAAEEEKCWGVALAGQNACNTNNSKHTCAGHSKVDRDPNDFIPLPKGTCLKIGGKLEPAGDKSKSTDSM